MNAIFRVLLAAVQVKRVTDGANLTGIYAEAW